jgi:gas vesicle protein
MDTEETLGKSNGEVEVNESPRGTPGFAGGLLFGVVLGAAFALLFAPERGAKTRDRLGRRMRSLREDARDTLDEAGSRTRKELNRRKRRLRAELERVRERAKERAREAKEALE